MSRIFRAPAPLVLALVAGLMALGVAGCASGAAKPTAIPPAQTPTQPPVITRIVPPPPSPTPSPIPTPAPEILDAAGNWTLRVTLDVRGSAFVERQSYFGAVSFTADERGAVRGSGYFTPTLDGGRCEAVALAEEPITYRVEGEVLPGEDGPRVDLRLIPDDIRQREPVRVTCPDAFADVRERDQPFLWPVLRALDLMTWPLALEVGQTFRFERDLGATATGFEGALEGTVEVNRG